MVLLERLILGLLGVVGIVFLWLWYPEHINSLLDANLAIIKFVGRMLPVPYGAQFESAVRFLAGEKAMIFSEASILFLIIKMWFSKFF